MNPLTHFPDEDPLPLWFVALFIICTLVAFGVAGHLDYQAERAFECNRYGKSYDADKDVCIPFQPHSK